MSTRDRSADRLTNLPPYIFADIARRIRELTAEGHRVIRLDIGSPDGAPPPRVIETLAQAAAHPDKHGYSGYSGTPEFRRAVAGFYERRFQVQLEPDKEVLPLMGSKEGLFNLCLGFLNPGDVILLPDISYPVYSRASQLADAEIAWFPLSPENHFLPDLSRIPARVAERAKMMFINYPNNPTGMVMEAAEYQQIVDFCREHQILLVSDNPYFDITFENCVAGSLLQAKGAAQVGIELMSFSKSYNMGGWRLGAAVGEPKVLRQLMEMKSNVDSGHFIAMYDAGIAALEQTEPEWEQQRNRIYQRRRDLVMEGLAAVGLKALKPQGAMYVWAQVKAGSSEDYARQALDEAHVSLTPGDAFGPGGQGYVRFSLCTPDEQTSEALQRLRTWYENR